MIEIKEDQKVVEMVCLECLKNGVERKTKYLSLHLKIHNLTLEKYLELHPNAPISHPSYNSILQDKNSKSHKGVCPVSAFKKGNIPWNKNLTKYIDERIAKIAENKIIKRETRICPICLIPFIVTINSIQKTCSKDCGYKLMGLGNKERANYRKKIIVVDEEEESKKIKCEICGRKLHVISKVHLKKHNYTVEEYKIKYPNSKLTSNFYLEARRLGGGKFFKELALIRKGKTNIIYYGEEKAKNIRKNRKTNSSQFKKGHIPHNKNKSLVEEYGEEKAKEINEKQIKSGKIKWNNNVYRETQTKAILKGLNKRPTSYEEPIICLCEYYNLPFKYIGDGEEIINGYNPDFRDTLGLGLYIEPHHSWTKEDELKYVKERPKQLEVSTANILFLNDEFFNLDFDEWKYQCLIKIFGLLFYGAWMKNDMELYNKLYKQAEEIFNRDEFKNKLRLTDCNEKERIKIRKI